MQPKKVRLHAIFENRTYDFRTRLLLLTNTGPWDIRLWRYKPTIIRVDSSRVVKLYRKVIGANNTRLSAITVQDAIKQFSGPNNWTIETHDNLEISAAMAEGDVPLKYRSAVF